MFNKNMKKNPKGFFFLLSYERYKQKRTNKKEFAHENEASVKSINCGCACTKSNLYLIDTPNNENAIKWCEYAILWEFEEFEDCSIATQFLQSGYISEWQNLLLAPSYRE